jgi:hypothetical protein
MRVPRFMRNVSLGLALVVAGSALPGCVVVRTPHAGYYYGGGGLGLFMLIFVLALLFGRRRA